MLDSPVNDVLGTSIPIVQAPMGRWAAPELAVAVCKVGGLGTIGILHPYRTLSVSEVRERVSLIRRQTDQPFGVGFITPYLPSVRPHFDAVLEDSVPVVLLSFGDPSSWIHIIHETGAKVICQVQTFELARKAVEAGTDVLCVQGNEAGGHTGRENLLPLLIQVVDTFPNTPTIASGGISSGRALAAVLAAGAAGAWIGTALVATQEATFTSPEFRQAIIESNGRDTVHSRGFDIINAHAFSRDDWPEEIAARHRRNPITERWDGHEEELASNTEALDSYAERLSAGDPEIFPLFYGQGAGSIHQVRAVRETVESMVSDALFRLNRGANQLFY